MQLKPQGAKLWTKVEIQHEILCNTNFYSVAPVEVVYKFLP